MRWIARVALALLLLFMVAMLAMYFGSRAWRGETETMITALERVSDIIPVKSVDFAELDSLPFPVARYFRYALKDGQSTVKSCRFVQVGEMRQKMSDVKWMKFKAVQRFHPESPGFVWVADFPVAPPMKIVVRDAFVEGRGSMEVKAGFLYTLSNIYGTPEIDAGALQRYLAELAWLPTALLPGGGVSWSPIDSSRALAELTAGGTTVALEFSFAYSGELLSIYTPARFKEVGGHFESYPWAAHYYDYREFDGMMVPTSAEVEWQMPEGKFVYWKGRCAGFEFEFNE